MAEAFVIVLALLNPATADPIRRCLCSPLVKTALGSSQTGFPNLRVTSDECTVYGVSVSGC